jgi:concanavalin A-like lectin/glucanase superfamily protein
MPTLRLIVLGIVYVARAQPGCAAAPPGISAWFTFDEPMFRQPGAHRPQRVPGMVGSALRFNGIDQYFEVPAPTPGLDMGEDDFTIELWIRTKQSVGTPSIVDKRGHQPLGYLIFTYKGRPALQLADGSRGRGPFWDVSIADGRWHHVAGVVKRLPPQPAAIFVDGVRLDTKYSGPATLTNLDVPQPLWLGRHHANGYRDREDIYFQGDIDELTFYRRALTEKEIRSIFQAGAHGKCHAR